MRDAHLNTVDLGSGPAVVLLHGFIGPASHLEPLAEALSTWHRVLLVDLPGYGLTPSLPGPCSLATTYELIEDAVLTRGLRSVALVGFSVGGYRALGLACRGRIDVSTVTTLGGFANLPSATRESHREIARALRAGADLQEVAVTHFLSPRFARANPSTVAEIRSWLEPSRFEALADEAEAIAGCEDLRPRLERLSLPVVARVGEADRATPVALSREIAATVTHGTLEVVPSAGHALVAEDLRGTLASIRRTLAAGNAASRRARA